MLAACRSTTTCSAQPLPPPGSLGSARRSRPSSRRSRSRASAPISSRSRRLPTAGARGVRAAAGGGRWVAVAGGGEPITSRDRVREAIQIAAICEVAEEAVPEELRTAPPRLASPQYLDSLGTGRADALPAVLQGAVAAVEELAQDVEDHYKVELR